MIFTKDWSDCKEPGIDWDQVRGGRQFRRSLAALGDEKFSILLIILQRALSDP